MTQSPEPPPGEPTPPGPPPSFGTPEPPAYGTPAPPVGGPPPAYGQPAAPPQPSAQQPYGQQYGAPTGIAPADARLWALLAHLGGILFGFLAPLVVWLIYKDRDAYVKDQSLEALNFQLALLIGWVAAFALTLVVIGFLLMPLLWIGGLVFSIVAAMAANRGEYYRYPVTLRLIK